MNYTELLKNIWDTLYDPQKNILVTIDTFSHKGYEQCIN